MKGRVAFIPAPHKIEFREYEVPAVVAGGLIATVTQTNVCGSEAAALVGHTLIPSLKMPRPILRTQRLPFRT